MLKMFGAGSFVHTAYMQPLAPASASRESKCDFRSGMESRTCQDTLMYRLPPVPTMLAFPHQTSALRSQLMALCMQARMAA